MHRRNFLATSLAFGSGLLVSVPAIASSGAINILHGYSINSTTGNFARFVAALLGRDDKLNTVSHSFPGNHGWNSIEFMKTVEGSETHLIVADALTMALYAKYHDGESFVRSLTPVAKVTNGISTCLIASKASGLTDWDSLKKAAQTRELRVASTGVRSAYGVAVDWVSTYAAPMKEVSKLGNGDILQAVENGTVDVGVVSTNSLPLPTDSDFDKVTRICTFGAKRSVSFPQTPTFAELVGDDKRDYTIAFSVFAPANVSKAFADDLEQKLLVPATADLVAPLGSLALNVQPEPAKIVVETLDRDLRVVASLASHN